MTSGVHGVVENSYFENNFAYDLGGTIIIKEYSQIKINNCVFNGSLTYGKGGCKINN